MHPALADPVPHDSSNTQACRDGCAFEVFRFARSIFWQGLYSDVEAGKASEAAEHEESEEEVIDGSTEAHCEGADSRRDTE